MMTVSYLTVDNMTTIWQHLSIMFMNTIVADSGNAVPKDLACLNVLPVLQILAYVMIRKLYLLTADTNTQLALYVIGLGMSCVLDLLKDPQHQQLHLILAV